MARRHRPADPALIGAGAAAAALALFAGALLSWVLPKGTLGSSSVLTVVPPESVVATAAGSATDTATSPSSSGSGAAPGSDPAASAAVEVTRLDWAPDSHRLAVVAGVVPAPSEAAICEVVVTTSSGEIVAPGTWSGAVEGGRECSAAIEDARLDSGAGEVRVRVTDGAEVLESRPLPLG